MEIIGLVFNMIGTALLFIFGFPQPNLHEGVHLDLEENTEFTDGTSVKSINGLIKKKRVIYKTISLMALGLLFTGFGLQLYSLFCS